MKLISLRPPYAALVAMKLKQYETRGWATDYRGKLLIHTTKKRFNLERLGTVLQIPDNEYFTHPKNNTSVSIKEELSRSNQSLFCQNLGCIVAIADLIDCREMYNNLLKVDRSWQYINIAEQLSLEVAVGIWEPGRYALRLKNVIALPQPILLNRGSQGKPIPVSPEIITEVNRQLQVNQVAV